MRPTLMARIRSLKPEFAKDETIAELPRDVRLHFALLWTYADDAGRGNDNPKLIKAELWPLDDDISAEIVEKWQGLLEEKGRIVRYEVDGRHFFEVVHFARHQHPQKPSESKLPPIPDDTDGPPISLREGYATAPVELPPVVVGDKDLSSEKGRDPEPRREDVDTLCDLLADLMEGNGCRRPAVRNEWRTQGRLLLDKDGIPRDEAERVLRWALADPFWSTNILSMPKFREKFDQLQLKSRQHTAPEDREAEFDEWAKR